MLKLLELAKTIGMALGALVLLSTIYSGFVGFVGGRVIPWLTESEIDGKIVVALAELKAQRNFDMCQDYTNRLARATAALQRNASDMVALDLANAARMQISNISGCKAP